MYIFLILACIFTLLRVPATATTPTALVSPFHSPSIVPKHCRKIEEDMNACFGGTISLLGDLELDKDAIKRCVCSKDSLTIETVTSCTGDPNTWSELCGDDLKAQEAGFGFSVSL